MVFENWKSLGEHYNQLRISRLNNLLFEHLAERGNLNNLCVIEKKYLGLYGDYNDFVFRSFEQTLQAGKFNAACRMLAGILAKLFEENGTESVDDGVSVVDATYRREFDIDRFDLPRMFHRLTLASQNFDGVCSRLFGELLSRGHFEEALSIEGYLGKFFDGIPSVSKFVEQKNLQRQQQTKRHPF